jgi:hypothetical protein
MLRPGGSELQPVNGDGSSVEPFCNVLDPEVYFSQKKILFPLVCSMLAWPMSSNRNITYTLSRSTRGPQQRRFQG